MHFFKGGWDCTGAFASDLSRLSQSGGSKLFKYMHGSEFGMGQRFVWQLLYVFDRPGQVFQHDQWYFVSVSRPGQLWISHSVECSLKMKKIHDWGGSTNSPESGRKALEGKTLPVMMGAHPVLSGRENILLSLNSNMLAGHSSQNTVDRDHCNVTSVTCWSMCVKSLLDTSNLRYWELIKSVQDGLRVRSGVQGNELKKNITKFTKKVLLITR